VVLEKDPKGDGSRRRRRTLQAIGSVVALVAIGYFAFTKFTSFSAVWDSIKALTWLEIGTLIAAALWNIVTYWFVMVAALPGSNYWQAMKINQASTAVANTLPGGGALALGVSYGMYSASGFSRRAIGLSMVVSGVWNNFVKLTMPIVALALLAMQGNITTARATAAGLGLLVLAVALIAFASVLRSEHAARVIGTWAERAISGIRRGLRKPPVNDWGDALVRFRDEANALLRRRWAALTIASIVSHLSLYGVLLLTLRHVGIAETEVSWVEVLAVFAFVRLISAIPITPGGLGVVELGLTAGLVTAGGARPGVVAGVLVYRALTWALPIPLGIAMYLRWIRGAEARRRRTLQSQADPRVEISIVDERVG